MKLKQWLIEYKNMSYAEYKELPDYERYRIEGEHMEFCRKENLRRQSHDKQDVRPMTEEEKAKISVVCAKEKERYEASLKCGGIDDNGNYTALHHRWD